MYAGLFDGAERAGYALPRGRRAWVHLARGALALNEHAPDRRRWRRAERSSASSRCTTGSDAEVLLFDLP